MRRRFSKFPFFTDGARSLRILKIITVASPALFILLLELLRHTLFEETRPMILGNILLLVAVTVAAFFFSRLVFGLIARIQEENLRRNRELAILNEMAQTVNESLNLNVLLRRAIDKLLQVTTSDSGELYLVDEQSRQLVHTLHAGLSAEALKPDPKFLTDNGFMEEITRTNEAVIIPDLKDGGPAAAALASAGFRSLAIIPLKSRSGIVGVVGLFSLKSGHFKPNSASLLSNVGNQIATAIENARLYEKVQAVAVIEERERISKELHDGLAQVLGYVITKSQATRQLLRKITVATDYLLELENIAQEVYTDTREDILGLRTATSGDRNMVSALREYLVRFNQMHGIKTTLEVGDRIIPTLSPQVELQAIRIVQEALSNVRKHAEATRVSVKVEASDNEVDIVVEDDGKGFNIDEPGQSDWSKFGIRNIKERAESIHSRLDIESAPESGTRVTLRIPLTVSPPTVKEGEEIASTDS